MVGAYLTHQFKVLQLFVDSLEVGSRWVHQEFTYRSSSFIYSRSKVSSQPTSMRMRIPLSSSKRD